MCLIIIDCHNCFYIISCFFCCNFIQTCSCCIEPRHFYNCCSQYTMKFFFCTRENLCQKTTFHICRRTHRRPCLLSCLEIRHHCTIPCCIYIRQCSTHGMVYQNSPIFCKFQSCISQKCCVGTNSQRQYHNICFQKTFICLYACCTSISCNFFHFCSC